MTEKNTMAALSDARRLAQAYLEQRQAEIGAEYAAAADAVRQKYEDDLNAARSAVLGERDAVNLNLTKIAARLAFATAPWTEEAWEGYPARVPEDAILGSIRGGVLPESFPELGFPVIPMLFPLETGPIVIVSEGVSKLKAREILRGLAARAILLLGGAGARFILVDPVAAGANFPFSALPAAIRGQSVLRQPDEIAAALESAAQADDGTAVIICAADFPTRWNSETVSALTALTGRSGGAAVSAILHFDKDLARPDGFDAAPLLETASVITVTETGISARVGGVEYAFDPDGPPSASLLETLTAALAAAIGS